MPKVITFKKLKLFNKLRNVSNFRKTKRSKLIDSFIEITLLKNLFVRNRLRTSVSNHKSKIESEYKLFLLTIVVSLTEGHYKGEFFF